MSEEQTEEEPSIEDILDSIRQIISDEDDDGGVEAPEEDVNAEEDVAAAAEAPEVEPEAESPVIEEEPEMPEDDEDVLELTETVDQQSEFSAESVEEEPEIEAAFIDPDEDDVLAAVESEVDSVPETQMEPAIDDIGDFDIAMEAPGDDSIMTEAAQDAAYEGFSELVKQTRVEANGITLEEIVRSELNPLLREWLDKNLPPMIERLVQEELAKIAKRVLDE